MKIEQLSDERIVVELSARDMDELEITYEDMDYANIETRRVIWTLLDRAGRTLGRDIDPSGRMMIEVIPRREGGCVLQFTLIGTTKVLQSGRKPPLLPRSTKPPCLVFAFASIDPVMDAARAWVRFGAPLPEHAALYEKSGQYRLILTPGKRPGAICAFIKEWGDLLPGGNMTAAATREYWQEIVAESALERLAGVEA